MVCDFQLIKKFIIGGQVSIRDLLPYIFTDIASIKLGSYHSPTESPNQRPPRDFSIGVVNFPYSIWQIYSPNKKRIFPFTLVFDPFPFEYAVFKWHEHDTEREPVIHRHYLGVKDFLYNSFLSLGFLSLKHLFHL